jgi:hypothetical protein
VVVGLILLHSVDRYRVRGIGYKASRDLLLGDPEEEEEDKAHSEEDHDPRDERIRTQEASEAARLMGAIILGFGTGE